MRALHNLWLIFLFHSGPQGCAELPALDVGQCASPESRKNASLQWSHNAHKEIQPKTKLLHRAKTTSRLRLRTELELAHG